MSNSRKNMKTSISSLPDDLILDCLARVSRTKHAALSLVSKNFRSLVASPDLLYKTRSLSGCTENFLYVCLLSPPDPTPRWFVLCTVKTGDRLLRPILSFPSQALEGSSVVALDWGIYVIGGIMKGKPSRDVLLLDCRTHKWHQVPSMGVARSSAAVGVVSGKIYVFGGCYDSDSSNWAEVFDPETQTWNCLPPIPDRITRFQYIHDSVVVREEKVYAVDLTERTFYYSPGEGRWGRGNHGETQAKRRDWCVIDGYIYCCDPLGNLWVCELEQLERSEPDGMHWRQVKGLGSLNEILSRSRLIHFDERLEDCSAYIYNSRKKLREILPGARLSNSGGNLVILWDVIEWCHCEIWGAEVSLEKRKEGEIWGNIEWSNAVMTLDPLLHHHKVLHSVSVTL